MVDGFEVGVQRLAVSEEGVAGFNRWCDDDYSRFVISGVDVFLVVFIYAV